MEKLKNKRYMSFDYLSRYTSSPYYYDTKAQKDVYGIGEQMLKTTSFITHPLKPDDTLDSLALTYYNDPTFWWVIAYFNSITDPFVPLMDLFNKIKIPNITSIVFKNER